MSSKSSKFDRHGFQILHHEPSPPSSPTVCPFNLPLSSSVKLTPSSTYAVTPEVVVRATISSPSCACSSATCAGIKKGTRTRSRERNGRENILPRRNECVSQKVESSWEAILDGWKENDKYLQGKLHTLLNEGVPASLRPKLWRTLLDSRTLAAASQFNYKANVVAVREQLVDIGVTEYGGTDMLIALNQMEFENDRVLLKKGLVPVRYIRQIMADLERTFPTHRLFMGETAEAKEGRAALFRVLAVYARYNKKVGYCQGMSSIAGMLLMMMDEEDTFWCIVSLLERQKYLQGYFDVALTRIHQHGSIFKKLLQRRHPDLAEHFEENGVEVLMFITPWLMSLFTCLSCWDTVLAVWDLLIVQGYTVIFQVSLAIISLCEKELLKDSDLSMIVPMLLHPPHNVVAHDTLLPVIRKTVVEKWEIDSLQAVVIEEQAGRSRKRKHREEEEGYLLDRQMKRRSVEHASMDKSLFSKIVNIFSWNSEADTTPRKTAKARSLKNSTRVPGKAQTAFTSRPHLKQGNSNCEEATNAKGVRQSPRLALRTLNVKNSGLATDRLVGKSAKTRHAFREFVTPVPLRSTQKVYASPKFHASPYKELKSFEKS